MGVNGLHKAREFLPCKGDTWIRRSSTFGRGRPQVVPHHSHQVERRSYRFGVRTSLYSDGQASKGQTMLVPMVHRVFLLFHRRLLGPRASR
jgi:hypothetical protein